MNALKPVYQVKHFILRYFRIFLLQSNGLHSDGRVLLRGEWGIQGDGACPGAEVVPFLMLNCVRCALIALTLPICTASIAALL